MEKKQLVKKTKSTTGSISFMFTPVSCNAPNTLPSQPDCFTVT